MFREITPIVVTYNSKHLLPNIQNNISLFNKFILVDNSQEDSQKISDTLRDKCPNGVIIEAPFNLGYGAGNNLGMHQVETEFALVLNPDVSLDAQAVASMLDVITRYPKAMVVGANVFNPTLNRFEKSFDWYYGLKGNKRSIVTKPTGEISTMFLYGCCLLIRKNIFAEIGLFDENFFMYFEEYDIARRAIQKGYDVVLSNEAIVSHYSNTSSTYSLKVHWIKTLNNERSKRIFLTKYGYSKFSIVKKICLFFYNLTCALLSLIMVRPHKVVLYLARSISYIVK